MISYKYWKLLQESLDNTVNLGVRSPSNLGIMAEAPQLFGMMGKRMMDGDTPDMGKALGKPGMGKPGMGAPDMSDDDEEGGNDMGGDDDEGGDEMGDEDDMGGEGGDEDGDDMGGEGGDDDEGGDEDMGGEGPPPGMMGKPGMGKPKPGMKPPMGKPDMAPSFMKKEQKEVLPWQKVKKSDPDDTKKKKQNTKNDAKDANNPMNANKGKPGFCKKCGSDEENCSKGCSKAKKMTKEQAEFLSSLAKMTGGNKFAKNEVGEWVPVSEDYLIDNDTTESNDPKPGDVGYAPNQYMGLSGNLSSTTTYQEWLSRRKK